MKLLQAENAELKRANDKLAHDKEESQLEYDRLAQERDSKEQRFSSLEMALAKSRGEVQTVRHSFRAIHTYLPRTLAAYYAFSFFCIIKKQLVARRCARVWQTFRRSWNRAEWTYRLRHGSTNSR